MRIKYVLTFFILLLIIACNSYQPFSSSKEKRMKSETIKKDLKLSSKNFKKIKKEDSILFSIATALEKKVRLNLIKRRLDSFFSNNYTKKELLTILKLDYNFPKIKKPFEFNRRKDAQGIDFKDINEMKKFFNEGGVEKKLDSVLGMKKRDSTQKKNR
ncbi:hypothetical protein EZY14_005985 [Kordia sp. TARA_039_SRF]|nr:hypothetical protein EZY14_005985 [Kordia sp. TARA_039_SRF]